MKQKMEKAKGRKRMKPKEIKEFVNHIKKIQKNPQIMKAAKEFYRLTTNKLRGESLQKKEQ